MLNFACDYLDAAHPKVFEALMKNNFVKTGCYDESESDCFCNAAREKIRAACGVPDAEVRFLSGGTQTNKVVISTMLKPWQGVIAARTGHIAVHEAGAIEASGHKVIEIAEHQGKISAEAVDKVFALGTVTATAFTWWSRAWSTSRSRRNTAPSIRSRN